MLIEDLFREALRRAGADRPLADHLWNEVAQAYGSRGRHYHTLDHLEHVTRALEPHAAELEDRDAVVFAIVYHDIVYRVARNDNEEASAGVMRERLGPTGLLPERIERIAAHILATKAHGATSDPDTAFFTDADLSILGAPPAEYGKYTRAIRQEYRRYPDLLYKPGRRKVLQHFLAMPAIYRTGPFRTRLEAAARANLSAELKG